MTARAAGTFTVASWAEDTYAELDDKRKLTKATVTYRLSGGIEGEATWAALMFYRAGGTAEYTGLQHVSGQIAGRSGTCVMIADGSYADGTASGTWRVIPGSGTGGLTGLSGSGTSVATSTPPGTYTVDYELDRASGRAGHRPDGEPARRAVAGARRPDGRRHGRGGR